MIAALMTKEAAPATLLAVCGVCGETLDVIVSGMGSTGSWRKRQGGGVRLADTEVMELSGHTRCKCGWETWVRVDRIFPFNQHTTSIEEALAAAPEH